MSYLGYFLNAVVVFKKKIDKTTRKTILNRVVSVVQTHIPTK